MALIGLAAAHAQDAVPLPSMGEVASIEHPRFNFSLLPKAFQQNPELDMTVICEVTDFGRKLPEVTTQAPAYYLVHDNGMKAFGEQMAGGDPPKAEYIAQILQRSLAGRGYLPANPAHPPTLALFYTWGTHYAMDKDTQTHFPEQARREEQERASLIGGKDLVIRDQREKDSIAPWVTNTDVRHDYLTAAMRSGMYFMVVSAYDYAALAHGRRELVWRTRMTVDATGVAMKESLPPLLLTASVYFGRDMKQSDILTRPVRRGSVTLAPLEVLDQTPSLPPPPAKK